MSAIKTWSQQDRPREKMQAHGSAVLSDAELLAILIGSGTVTQSAVDLARQILSDCDNNLSLLGKLTLKQLTAYPGIGTAKAITILSAIEIGNRRISSELSSTPSVRSSDDIFRLMHPVLHDLHEEQCWLVMINQTSHVISKECISHGTDSTATVDIKKVLSKCLQSDCNKFVLTHNHPSGSTTPSNADKSLTARLIAASETIGLNFMDHVIITEDSYFSFRSSTDMFNKK